MRFGLFFVGEYINMIILGSMTTVFFLGGWHGPLLPPVVWFLIKVLAVFCLYLDARHPAAVALRPADAFRLEILFPVALVNVVVTGRCCLAGVSCEGHGPI